MGCILVGDRMSLASATACARSAPASTSASWIETGILSFEAVFMPYMLTADGRPLHERIAETGLLPSASPSTVVQLPKP
jgi:hypothetical protein